jgi:hypothetical protein
MNKKWLPHIIAIEAFAIFIVLGLACASTPDSSSSNRQSAQEQQQQTSQTPAQQVQGQQTPAPKTSASSFFTGNGGKGMRLGILMPYSQGLNENQGYLPALIQGILVSDISKYSAISVLDRVSLDRVITETLDLTYEDDLDIVSLGHVAQVGHMMTGNIIQTSSGFTLQLNVTDTTARANTIASYSGTCTAAELDDHSAIHHASLELLTQMNVQLNARARNELARASEPETVNAQTALAQGVTAQRKGTEVAALSYYLQAASLDPSLAEAESRLEILTSSITKGSMGADVRNDIQWRSQWIARLRETEQFITQYLKENRSHYLVYSPVTQGTVDYAKETVTLNIELRSLPEPLSFETINKLTRTIKNGLIATGRAETWGIDWPGQSITTPSPFFTAPNYCSVVVELLNAGGKSVGSQAANIQLGGWFMPDGGALSGITAAPYLRPPVRIEFPGVDVKQIDNLTIRIATINGIPAERATAQMGLRILPQDDYDRIPGITDNGLQTANLRLYEIRFDQNRNLIRGYKGGTHAVIPYGITLLDGDSGLREKQLSAVTIPPSVLQIGSYAFYKNLLTSVTIPDNVTSIGRSAFRTNRLTSIFIGSGVTYIEEWAFNDNELLSFTIGANVSITGGYGSESLGNSRRNDVYINNNRKAGIYAWDGSKWVYKGK